MFHALPEIFGIKIYIFMSKELYYMDIDLLYMHTAL